MALHILLADDSVPAQNMGKKILTEAGYDVTTVSNGLEALRKIAETVPDIAILDIFMPGYSGLEICQKMRAGTATASLPVILTVGKLEPYRAEDGERVHSNAVIVKPFAAAELISAVHSLVGAAPEAAPLPASEHPKFAGAFASALASVPHTEAEADEPPDEPLFTYGSSLGDEPESQPSASDAAPPEPGQAAVEDAQSLVYNPDAAHTPFRASATDFLSPTPQPSAENEDAPITEFGLESSESVYSSTPEQAAPEILSASPMNETSIANEPTGPSSAAAPSAAPEVPFEFEPLASEAPTLDPLLEVPEDHASPNILDSNLQGEAPEALMTDGFSQPEESPAEPLSPEEEARLKAFEDLFNSSDLPPLEPSPVVDAALHMEILPSISHTADELAMETPRDPELELLGHDAPPTPLIAQSDPELLEEEAPRNAIGNIPDRDVMLDDLTESGQGHAALEELLPTFDDQFAAKPYASFELEEAAAPAVVPEVESPYSAEAPVPAEVPEPVELTPEAAIPVVEHTAEPVISEPEAEPVAAEAAPEQTAPVESHSIYSEPDVLVAEPSFVLAPPEPEPAAIAEPVAAVAIAQPTPEPVEVFSELEAQQALAEATPAPPEVEPPAVEAEPAAVSPEPVSQAAPPAAEPVPEAETPVPTPAKPVSSRSFISELAAFGSGAGFTATLPSLVHFVEAEVKHAFSHAAPAPHQEESHPVEAAVLAEPHVASVAPVSVPSEVTEPEPKQPEAEAQPVAASELEASASLASVGETPVHSYEAERIHQAVEKVFERFKPLLIAAIVRELARHD